ncbi:MAG TPA: family 78 glycoside hydrolase catalytic domain [Nocardioides sp.]|nr:family 78 glycoside hydrolase catalytic domain [Nocardioides sp.]
MVVSPVRLLSLFVLALSLVVAPGTLALSPQALSAMAADSAGARPVVEGLRTNGLTNPLGTSGEPPQLSWTMDAPRRGVTQQAYQVRVSQAGGPVVWDSGRVESRDSVEVPYGGPALASQTPYAWTVRVWDDRGSVSDWSDTATFETGVLDDSEWTADWIGAPDQRLGPEWTDYTVDFTASGIRGALGLYFRGSDTEHAYMWQISEADRSLRPHVKNPGYSVLPATPFPAGFDFAAPHDYRVEVAGNRITTSVDGQVLDTRTDGTHAGPGIVGFRTSGAERGLVHDVTVTSADGTVLVDTDFPKGDRTFTSGTVTEEGLRVDAAGPEAWFAVGDEVPLLRKDFVVQDKEIERARVYASAQGLYELQLNGQRVGDHELAPGWTDYHRRIQYQTYDVTDLLTAGDNALGAQLADGWFSGRVAMFGNNIYGDRNALVTQLRIDYADGTSDVVVSDGSWRTTPGPITAADLLDGESYDARRAAEIGAWSSPGYDASGWKGVDVLPSATSLLEPQDDQPVRETQELEAEQIDSPTPGTHLYDLGQNMVGKVRLTLTGEPGATVRIRHGEVLNPDGTLYTANLRSAKATDYYTFATDGPETFEPTFTFHGFRYVEITGVDEAPAASSVTGVVLGTDGDLVSEFDTSNPMVDQLHSNIVWGQRGNFLSVPTDTPARDERMGWTGDINVFARTAVYNMDSQAFLNKWLEDLRDTQRADGALPGVAPIIPGRFDGGYGPAGWADAMVHVPWTVWQAYGDTTVVRENYDAMKRYVDYLDRDSTGHIRSAGGYLDWLNLDDPTPADVLDTAFVAKSTREFAEMAEALGRDADAAAYRQRFEAIKRAYQDAFVAADGTVKGDSQTSYILTINNGLVPKGREKAVADQFVETIARRDWHLSTGFLGVDGLLPALTAIDRTDVAYRLLQNEDYPSWGYEIAKGATTIWERWNSIGPNGEFGDVGMNSFNHYAYGASGEWMYRTLAGVSALEPGYRKVLIAPEPGAGIDSASLSHRTPYGVVSSSWVTGEDGMSLDVTVPGNSTAEVHVPAVNRWAVTEGGRPAADADGVRFLRMEDGSAVFSVGSGDYQFAVDAVLGRLGAARDGVASVGDAVTRLSDDGSIRSATRSHLDAQLGKLAREVEGAWTGYVAGDTDQVVADVHRALATSADLRRWLATQRDTGRLTPADAAGLTDGLRAVERQLSAASGLLVGAVAALVPPTGDNLPGDTVPVSVTVTNKGTRPLESVASTLSAPEGWTVARPAAPSTTVAPGQTASHTYQVTVPEETAAGAVELTGEVTYRHQAGTATLPVAGSLVVVPAVVVDAVSATPARVSPGDTATVTTVVENVSRETRSGELRLTVPEGWAAPAAQQFTVAAGERLEVPVDVAVPLAVTGGPASVTAAIGATELERAASALDVRFANPPARAVDHVDLGVADSERDHRLTASGSSGTNTEAGLTRRYTNSAAPGGWFELDLAVPTTGPVLIRAVETFDQAQLKTYDVVLDGEVVHERRYRRTEGGMGSVSYQFLVDRPDLTSDGIVRLRFQDVGADYDPSIADVWSLPPTGGLDGGNLAAGARVSARSTLESGGWGTGRVVDGLQDSIAGGSKGYTSDANRSVAAQEWLAFDLGRERTLDTVVLFPRTETSDDKPGDGTDGAHFPRDFAVQTSADGSSWTTVHEVVDQPDPGAAAQSYAFDPVTARHVRILVTELGRPTAEEGGLGFHRLQLAEVELRRLVP